MEGFFCSYQGLSVIGLSLDIVGVLLIFIYAIPNLSTAYAVDEKYQKKIPFIKFMSYLGLVLILVGFIIQIYASIASYHHY